MQSLRVKRDCNMGNETGLRRPESISPSSSFPLWSRPSWAPRLITVRTHPLTNPLTYPLGHRRYVRAICSRGLPYMMSAKLVDSWTPPSSVHNIHGPFVHRFLLYFLTSSPFCADVIYGSPLCSNAISVPSHGKAEHIWSMKPYSFA